jgi:hypothetical protein
LEYRPGATSKFSTRTNSGEVVCRYPSAGGDTTADWALPSDKLWKPKVQAAWNGEAPLTIPYKYMFSRLRDKYEVLEEQIDDKAQLLAEIMKIDEWSPHNQLLSVISNHHLSLLSLGTSQDVAHDLFYSHYFLDPLSPLLY